jgi:hypothetical protein
VGDLDGESLMKQLTDDPEKLRQEIMALIEQYEIALDLLADGEVRQKMLQDVAELRKRFKELPPAPRPN